jgi:hypothetical protein
MTTTTTDAVSVAITEDAYGIPSAVVRSSGDATMADLRAEAERALAAHRAAQLRAPYPGSVQLVDHGQSGPDAFVTVFRPERIL